MSLSICLLTRNEESNLPRVLNSVAGLAGQIIVADTGSTDRTMAVASEMGATVCRFNWNDDFSAGRNFALGQATGDWIMWLNPDEEMVPASHALVRQALQRKEALAFKVVVEEMVHPGQVENWSETIQVRLFRRQPEIRFAGRVHPTFETPLEDLGVKQGMFIYRTAITVKHHGYLSTLSPNKLQWGARLFALELAEHPDQFPTLVHYGKTLLLLQDPEGHVLLARAADQLMPLQNAPEPPVPDVPILLEYLLTVPPQHSRSSLSREDAWKLARRWFPSSPPLIWIQASQLFRHGDYQEASRLLELLIQLGKTREYDRSQAFDPAIMGGFAWLNLGACFIYLGLFDRAEECFRQLAETEAYGRKARQYLNLLKDLKNRTAARQPINPQDLYFINPPEGD